MKVYELMSQLAQLEAGAEIAVVGDEDSSLCLDVMGVNMNGNGNFDDGYTITCYGSTRGDQV